MRGRKRKTFCALIALLLVVLIAYGVHWMFYDTQRIRGQEVLFSSDSPGGAYTVTAYLNNGGATTAYAVLCSVKDNMSGKSRNIYWQYRCEEARIEWMDETTVSINGVVLDVRNDVYDFRHAEEERAR